MEISTLILLTLHNKNMHGYAIMQEILNIADGTFSTNSGTLYRCLDRMESEHLLIEVTNDYKASDDKRRKYYHITASGRERLISDIKRLEILLELTKQIT